jgi:hypothetical protein
VQTASKFNGVQVPEYLLQNKDEQVTMVTQELKIELDHGDVVTEVKPDEKVVVNNVKDPGLKPTYSVMDMFKTPKLRKRSLILFYLWWVLYCM